MRLVQLQHPTEGRRIALVKEPDLILIKEFNSIYQMALDAIDKSMGIPEVVQKNISHTKLEYDPIYYGKSEWQLLPSYDHPDDVSKFMLAGTGLTHKASAENRQKMHQAKLESELTDSMKMYLWGVEGGKAKKNGIGVQPEWFYKGNGSVLKGHNQKLEVPAFGDDGGEEPEVAGIYVNDQKGNPWRIGFTIANEFSDHVMERKNYLYLAPSKIRNCAIGPELLITDDFTNISGKVSIVRKGEILWEQRIATGDENMCHNLSNLEHHHFKYENHRLPGMAQVHFFGAGAFSFGAGVALENGDEMNVSWEGFGRPLKNTLEIRSNKEKLVVVNSLA